MLQANGPPGRLQAARLPSDKWSGMLKKQDIREAGKIFAEWCTLRNKGYFTANASNQSFWLLSAFSLFL